jgi:signal transduction histidine kinase
MPAVFPSWFWTSSRIESGKMRRRFYSPGLVPCVTGTTESEISPEVKVWADESYLRRMLLNLLDNAIKYNVEGGVLSISLTKSDALALFRIANTGPGIPAGQETRVFERFYRADLSRSSDTGGSGLGLSICREIVGAHGGQMWLDEPRSGWTAFAVTLPGPKSGEPT